MKAPRWLRLTGKIALGLVALLVLLVGGLLLFLQTSLGGETVRKLVVPRVNEQIAGRLDLGSLRLHGFTLVLDRVTLHAPEGELVASLERLEVAIAPLALLHERVLVEHLFLDRPALHLASDARGLNLTRALEPRKKKPPEPSKPASKSSLAFELRQLRLRDGLVALRGPTRIEIDELTADGQAELAGAKTDVDLRLAARSRAPAEASIALAANVKGDGGALDGRLKLDFGDSSLAATLRGSGDIDTVKLEELVIDPALVRAFLPTAPGPVSVLRLAGQGRRSGKAVAADLTLAAGPGRIQVEVEALPEENRLRRLRVSGQNVDLAELLRQGPRSSLTFVIDGNAAGKDLASLRGQVKVQVPPSRLGPYRVGPILADVGAENGGIKLASLVAELPGLQVRAIGSGGPSALKLDAEVSATDLEALARALQPARGARGPSLGGSGKLTVGVRGTLRAPQLEARGSFRGLRAGDNAIRGADLRLSAANFFQPARARIDLTLAVQELRAAGRTWSQVKTTVAAAERQVRASVGVGTPSLSLDARATLARNSEGFTLEALTLAYPEARWKLAHPAEVSFGDSFAVQNLDLGDGQQRIAGTLALKPRRLEAHVTIAKLDLGRLPRAFVPPALNLAGRLDVDADVKGSAARPRGKVHLTLQGGRFRKVESLDLALNASHDGRRVSGDLAVRVPQTQAVGKFDLPAAWPPPERAPVMLELGVTPFDIPALMKAAGAAVPLDLRGRGSLAVHLSGTAGKPTASLLAVGKGLMLRGQDLGDSQLALAIETPGDETRLRVDAATCGGTVAVRASARVPLMKVPRLSRTALLHTPLEASVKIDRLPLRPLAKVAVTDLVSGGVLTVALDGHGTARAPEGKLDVALVGVSGPHLPATDLDLKATLDDDGNRASVRIRRRNTVLASLDARLRLPATRLEDQAALAAAPLNVNAHLGPLELARRDLPALAPGEQGQVLTGTLDADLKVDGSLQAPRLALLAGLQKAQLGKQVLGNAELALRYANARPDLLLKASTSNGGWMTIKGSAPLDLSYPRVTKGLALATVPLTVDLHSQGLDLAGVSGLSEPVRTVGGQLLADVKVRGTVTAPLVDGKVEWRDGRLALTGYGSYDRVHLQAHGDMNHVVLDDLSAHAPGNAQAKITAEGTRQGKSFELASKLDLRSFPIYSDGQPAGGVTLKGGASGTASAERIDVTTTLDEVRVALSPARPKRLQELKRPDDVVLLSDGEPIDAEQARKLRTLQALFAAQRNPTPRGARTRSLRLRAQVEAPRNIWVDGPDLHLELGLEPGFVVVSSNGQVRVFGTVDIKRGRVEVLGKRFDLDSSSTVRFTGPPDVPVLSVKATYQARSLGVQIQVNVDGPANAISLKLTSPTNPEYGDTELLTILATGHPPGERGASTTPSQQAASLLGGVVAAQLQKTLTKHLPLDVLIIEPGEGLSGSRLEAGTYLTNDVYVAYVGRVGADPFRRENSNEVQLEYQLSRRWSLEATYGDARKGSADLVWTKNY
jgi:translocation and assembly module TamB